jgi:hypothetical protein
MRGEPHLDHDIQCRSFSALLDQCLMLEQSKDELLVLYDESFFPYFDALLHVIRQRDLSVTFVFLPTSYQLRLIDRERSSRDSDTLQLPICLSRAIWASTAILNLLNGEQETVSVRVAVLAQGRSSDCRLAHIPGIDPKILSILSESPIAEIRRSSELLAWALGEAREAKVLTYDEGGHEHQLSLDLNGWDNDPIMSPGVIFPGSWGNVPPGETFCCPDPGKVCGTICINGSVPGHVMAKGEEVILTFDHGKLVDWQGHPHARKFFDEERSKANQRRDKNWSTFSELGIGLNPAISSLTGNSLFDEKAYGTIHVAIGNNTSFGHHIRSEIHADLVTWHPSLLLNGRPVMERGTLRIDAIEGERQSRHGMPVDIRPEVKIFLRDGRVENQDGELKRVLAKANRVGYVSMTGPEIGRLLAQVARTLSDLCEIGDITYGEFVKLHPEFGDVPTPDLLGLLDHYRVLGFSGI